jgi:hypothetical protein
MMQCTNAAVNHRMPRHDRIACFCRNNRVNLRSTSNWTEIPLLYQSIRVRCVVRHPDGKGLRRKDFSGPLATIRILRNRIAHHEPIIEWDLPKHPSKITELTGWFCPAAAEWCAAHSRFPEVCPPERITLHRNGGPGLRDPPLNPFSGPTEARSSR